MNRIEIFSTNDPHLQSLEEKINCAEDFSLIRLDGNFSLNLLKNKNFNIAQGIIKNFFTITKSNITLDFSGSKLMLELPFVDADISVFFLTQSAKNIRFINLNLEIKYTGNAGRNYLYAIYNNASGLKITGADISLHLFNQINAKAIFNNGNLETHLETQSDYMMVESGSIKIFHETAETRYENSVTGIHNHLANSVLIADTNIFVQNKGHCSAQKAIGIYNTGRFARINNNNIKANGSHNLGFSLEQASACAVLDEGLYSLISNNNIVGEWGGECIGLYMRGSFIKAAGNKILSTHTVKGTSLKADGEKSIIAQNIITSTSRNHRILDIKGRNIIIEGNYCEALLDISEYISGCGVYFENARECIFSNNQILNVKDCGLFLKNSDIRIDNNFIQANFYIPHYKDVAENDEYVQYMLKEERISSISK